jgi:surface-anchored protein
MKSYFSSIPALVLLALALPAQAAVTFTAGHGDIGMEYTGPGQLALHVHAHTGATVDGVPLPSDTEYEPDEIDVHVSTSAFHVQSDSSLVSGTGVMLGQGLWRLPESNNPLIPFLGFGAEELNAADWLGNLSFSLASISSPSGTGHFSVYQSDGLGGWNFFMSTADGIGAGDKIDIAAEGHDHYNMTFSEAGTWTINLFASGNHATDGLQTSGTHSFTFQVAPEPSRALLMGLGLMGLFFRRRR